MVDAHRQQETVETIEEFVTVSMTPDEAVILQAYLNHIQLERQREYLTDEVISLLADILNALKRIVPQTPIRVGKKDDSPETPATAPAPKRANVFD